MIFSNLRIYNISIDLVEELQVFVKQIPGFWKIKEVDQILRSSSSVAANIVEGYARKVYPKEYIRFLNFALGSSDETQCHIALLYVKKHISKKDYEYFLKKYKNLSIKILNLIKRIRDEKKIPYN